MTRQPVPNNLRQNARAMRKKMTDAELKLWNRLRAHRLIGLSFRRQMPIGSYIVDFACPQHRLIVEVDGSGHAQTEQINYDNRRTAYLNKQGWQVIRFCNDEVKNRIEDVCDHIIATLREKTAQVNDS